MTSMSSLVEASSYILQFNCYLYSSASIAYRSIDEIILFLSLCVFLTKSIAWWLLWGGKNVDIYWLYSKVCKWYKLIHQCLYMICWELQVRLTTKDNIRFKCVATYTNITFDFKSYKPLDHNMLLVWSEIILRVRIIV